MHATLVPVHPTTPWRNSIHCRVIGKPSILIDFSPLIARFKASSYNWSGNRSTDMPKTHENRSPKPHKSSNTRASPNLAVRQAPGTKSHRSAPSRAENSGGGSEADNVSRRSHSPSTTQASEPSQGPARRSDSDNNPSKPNLGPSAYIDTYVEYRKRLFIKIFMEKVDEWLDENVCPLEEACDYEEGSSSSSKSSGSTGKKSSGNRSKPPAGSKRQLRGDDQDEDRQGGEDGSRQDRNKKRAKTDVHDDRKRFACPFYKYDPKRYKHHRSCFGPGWTELHRLKEHLFRHHRVFTCSRCFEQFGEDEGLQKHVRARKACVLQDESAHEADPGAGMDRETEKKIRSRKPGKQSNVSRWYEIYSILFPDEVDIESLPSPWYDDPAGSNGNNTLSDSDDLKTQYQHFLRRRIPSMIREELEAEVAKSFNDVGSAMQSRLSTWIRDSAARCAKIFEYIPSPTEAAAQGDPDAAPSKSREGSPVSGPIGLVGASSFADGEPALVPWPYGFPSLADFDLSFEMPGQDYPAFEQCMHPTLDSAYESGSMGGSSRVWRG
ncbi:hypothetical protein CDEST_06942 [Colletotrichum destructivum]|uniref:C2H2-type domain-containing protein n=1 Tax=Colletotrichum destructivum TaxID=34406 RepID=A0AAX4IG10_9PEZI|nr:hypothetical protein CDEST_06942 [Colletotrichum destructivum]